MKQQSTLRRPMALAAVGLAAASVFTTLTAGAAEAVTAPIHITSTVNVRPGPSTASGNPIGSIPTNASPDYQCWTQGQNISGVDVWFRVNYAGVTGYYASYYDSSSYSSDGQITSKYGIPQCGAAAPAPAPASSAAQNAANWAAGHRGQNFDSGLCLTFVFQAWSAAGVNLRNYVTVPIGSNTYPVDIWGHFNHGTTGTGGNPPVGALVFYAAKNGDRTLSHITISTGGGNTVSTSDSLGSLVHNETVAQHSYATELGWWLPS